MPNQANRRAENREQASEREEKDAGEADQRVGHVVHVMPAGCGSPGSAGLSTPFVLTKIAATGPGARNSGSLDIGRVRGDGGGGHARLEQRALADVVAGRELHRDAENGAQRDRDPAERIPHG